MNLSKGGETYSKMLHYQTSQEVVSFSSVLGIDELPELRLELKEQCGSSKHDVQSHRYQVNQTNCTWRPVSSGV